MTTQNYLNRVGNLLKYGLTPAIKSTSIVQAVCTKKHLNNEDMVKLREAQLMNAQNSKLMRQIIKNWDRRERAKSLKLE